MSIIKQAKNLGLYHNVSFRVIDPISGKVVSEHIGHNNATNSMLTGMGHYLKGDGVWNQGYAMLHEYVPKYISLGTMGLINQDEDTHGLPAGLGVVSYKGKSYNDLSLENLEILGQPASARLVTNEDDEHLRLVDYMYQRPGYGADGYDPNLNNSRQFFGLGPVFNERLQPEVINCELVSDSFPRSQITFRDMVPEIESEIPKTIDVVFSAMISTGALAQFREPGRDHIFITEAGLWADPDWNNSGANGMLAGYRIAPSNSKDWDMSKPESREALKRSVIKVNKNQIVQVIWKIQLGSVDQFGGVDALYPGKIKKYWIDLPTKK